MKLAIFPRVLTNEASNPSPCVAQQFIAWDHINSGGTLVEEGSRTQ
jgi:hypothetical protein